MDTILYSRIRHQCTNSWPINSPPKRATRPTGFPINNNTDNTIKKHS